LSKIEFICLLTDVQYVMYLMDSPLTAQDFWE